MLLTEENFLLFAAKNYCNVNCITTEEFLDDLKRIKYIKKLLYSYKNKGQLKERLVLNHIIILYNVFETQSCTKMLYFKLEDYFDMVKPFLIMLGYLPKYIMDVKPTPVNTDLIGLDMEIVNRLREITKDMTDQ